MNVSLVEISQILNLSKGDIHGESKNLLFFSSIANLKSNSITFFTKNFEKIFNELENIFILANISYINC